MVFSSLTFICVFLPVVFLLYLVIPVASVRNAILIVASLFFYAFGEPIYVLLMLVSTVMNYLLGRIIGGLGDRRRAKVALVLAVVANLGFLAVFKYATLFVSTVDSVFGLSLTIPVVALPIGISFYTFQAMSYVIDVYRGHTVASRSYPKVLLYISFFPQLIAGPIIKYHDIERELDKRTITVDGVALGFRRFTVGLAKKVLVANNMAIVVDSLYAAEPSEVNFAVAWLAALAYILQIYFDFSGYSDMAIGLARMFGFHYKENFDYPYISASIKEFWRRWHISLSTWFKEYLYIPLGGNRKGRLRSSFNKVTVFFFCGLWHGASWTFVVWGLFHGLFLLIEDHLPVKRLPRALGIVYALVVVTVGFVLFRADSLEQALYFISQMFTGFWFDPASTALFMQQCTPLFLFTFVVAVFACLPLRFALDTRITDVRVRRALSNGGFAVSVVLLVVCLLDLSVGGYNPFIYFRF
ncbi:MAG TPA: MBOAT family protein [Coriobacteriia bacterium]|nr:MBOAT family protein [Coriobacteriia bacterium]